MIIRRIIPAKYNYRENTWRQRLPFEKRETSVISNEC